MNDVEVYSTDPYLQAGASHRRDGLVETLRRRARWIVLTPLHVSTYAAEETRVWNVNMSALN
jgi:hypothetical protein